VETVTLFRAFLGEEGPMGRGTSVVLGLLMLAIAAAGCAGQMTSAPMASAQQECERSGGIWRSNFCERASGGGGY